MGDVRFEVKQYIDLGWSVIPIPKGSKAPEIKDWVNRTFAVEDFTAESNVGVRLGEPSGHLTDVDLDCPQAVIAAKYLLPETECKHGRPGTGTSHYWYICEGAKSEKWCDIDGKVLVEIRSTGGQTVIPPSIHPSGEQIAWASFRSPSAVAYMPLRSHGRSTATGALLGRHWPSSGGRHDCAKHAAGFLAARDLDLGTICNIIKAACEAAGDTSELEDRIRVAADTVKTFAAGGKTTGGPSLEDGVGKEVVALLVKWYGGNSAIHDKVIEEMNANRFMSRVGKDTVYVLEEETGVVFQPARALFEEFAHQRVQVGTYARGEKKGEPILKTKFEIWREHPKKRNYRKVVFAPPPHQAHELDYNLWTGFAVPKLLPEEGHHARASIEALRAWADEVCYPKCQLFFELVRDVICAGNLEHYAYIVNLLALTVQFPGMPAEVAVVLKGKQGAGKGTFARTFGSLFGRHYVHLDRTEQLAGKFNAALSGKVVVFADEAFFAGDKSSLGSLKRLITEPTLAIERKGIDIIEEPNFLHLFMATNEDWAHQAGFRERRFMTLRVSDARMQDHAYFNAVTAQMKKGGEGLPALLSYLLTRVVDHDAVRKVPLTEELRVQQERSFTPELSWWRDCLFEGKVGNDRNWPDTIEPQELYDDYLRWCGIMRVQRIITKCDLLRRVLEPWLGKRTRKGTGFVRPLLPIDQARATFDEEAGTKGAWETDEEAGAKGSEPPKDLPF